MALFYDRDLGRNWHRGYDRGYRNEAGWGGFDRGGMRGEGRYDRGFKSRWQTDYGDPFGDRAARTPMRMIRGEFRGHEDRGFGWGSYDRDYSSSPMGYDPYFDPSRRMSTPGQWNRYDRGYRGRERGWGMGMRNRSERGERYDEGWF
ncbi:MAG TPA: hypothetical protein VFZ18_12935 [Longimicrobiaceae bacterium]